MGNYLKLKFNKMKKILIASAFIACSFFAQARTPDQSTTFVNAEPSVETSPSFDCWRYSYFCPDGAAVSTTFCYASACEAAEDGAASYNSTCANHQGDEVAPEE